jgi:alkanesulfonate monooxygenase SsuD/methylene tetrahydromethanopterin reductase-like flavin-dependent oxidoreductase (luciferase family)
MSVSTVFPTSPLGARPHLPQTGSGVLQDPSAHQAVFPTLGLMSRAIIVDDESIPSEAEQPAGLCRRRPHRHRHRGAVMRVGISIGTTFQVDDHRQGPRSVLEQARAAARAGLDTISLGDHHATGPTSYVQNVPMLGRVLAEWDDRPAGCLFLVPLWQPVLMAEQIGTLAAMASGPFIVQTGLGGGSAQFRAMGAHLSERGRLLEAGIVAVQALLNGETVSSEPWGIGDARIAPLPPQGTEWWIGAAAPVGIDRAARLGDCWYGNADLTPATAAATIAVYREACARHGREPIRIPIRKDVFIADTTAEADRVGDELMGEGYRGFERAAVAYGDPDAVAEQLAVFGELGFTDIIIRTMPATDDAAVRSVELAGEVRARLQPS